MGAHATPKPTTYTVRQKPVTLIGIVIGFAGGIAASVVARSLLYQIQAVEWLVLAGVAIVMLAMTMAIAYSAARPWMRVDPMQSVRHV